MNEEILSFILLTQKLEYGEFDASFRLRRFSPGLVSFLSPGRRIKEGAMISDVFIELLGYEPHLEEIRDGKQPPLQLDWINQTPLLISTDELSAAQPAFFFNLQVFPFQSGVLVVVRDTSAESDVEQRVYNRRNELDILSKKLIEDLEQANQELNQAYETTLEGWARTLEVRDMETKGHSIRVVNYTRLMADVIGFSETEMVYLNYGALLHDIGKIGIPDRILLKPGLLNDAERAIMQKHTLIGESLLRPIKYLEKALDIPCYHHEKWNGEGYPYGLAGEEIPLPARIFSIIDVYDALSHDRPYHKAWDHDDIVRYLKERSGKDFDPEIASIFLSIVA